MYSSHIQKGTEMLRQFVYLVHKLFILKTVIITKIYKWIKNINVYLFTILNL